MEFMAAPDDHRFPRLRDWVIRAPTAGQKEPLLLGQCSLIPKAIPNNVLSII
jgi:hypothetical protein